MQIIPPAYSRRHVLRGVGAGLSASLAVWALPARASPEADGARILRARAGKIRLRGPEHPETPVWSYDGGVPGPALRLKRGEELKVRLLNELPEPTAIHWHGLRLPNGMDGVPHLTQAPVAPGESFDYRFTAPDAGTFWYHSHLSSSEQVERGLYGPLIVEETEPVDIDRDLVFVLDDWRLDRDGRIHDESFGSMHDAAHAGRLGRLLTVNSQSNPDIPIRTNERLRLRFINAANARIFPLRLEGSAAWVMAIDGQPAEPFLARDGRFILGPGSRVDLFVDAGGEAFRVLADTLEGNEAAIIRFTPEARDDFRATSREAPKPLPANPLPARIDLKSAFRLDVPLEGGAMSPLMMRRMREGATIPGHGLDPAARLWTMAGLASSGHYGPALFSVPRGKPVVLAFHNDTAFPHGMHLHGHHFRLLDNLDDGWKPFWLDTVLIDARRTARIAFIADNPGKWMIHCHMLEHQEAGMAAWFDVT